MNSGKSAKIAKTLLILYVYVAIYTYKYVRLYVCAFVFHFADGICCNNVAAAYKLRQKKCDDKGRKINALLQLHSSNGGGTNKSTSG